MGMAALSYVQVATEKKFNHGLSRWHISGLVLGIVSALSSAGMLVYGIWIFANLHGPVGSYPQDAAFVYGITIALGQMIKRRKMMTEGRLFKFLDSMILGSSVVGLVLSVLVVRLGVQELPQIIARAFVPT